jgi:hypothetical protein
MTRHHFSSVVFVAICFSIAAFLSSGPQIHAQDCVNHGDANLDGVISAGDAQLAFFIVLGAYSPTYEEECAADCNGDGLVTAADAQAIFLVVIGSGDCADPLPTPEPEITLTLVNTFEPEGRALGLCVVENPHGAEVSVLGINNLEMRIYVYSIDGTAVSSIELDPANMNCFGLLFVDDYPSNTRFYTNDWDNTNLFYTDDNGTTWNTVFNPAVDKGRGMDFDGENYWTTYGSGAIMRFIPEYTPDDPILLPEISAQLTGLATFPYEGMVGIAVTAYHAHNIWFYIWNGVSLDYLGVAPVPIECDLSLGLSYSENLEHFFWSHKDDTGKYWISELSFTIEK